MMSSSKTHTTAVLAALEQLDGFWPDDYHAQSQIHDICRLGFMIGIVLKQRVKLGHVEMRKASTAAPLGYRITATGKRRLADLQGAEPPPRKEGASHLPSWRAQLRVERGEEDS